MLTNKLLAAVGITGALLLGASAEAFANPWRPVVVAPAYRPVVVAPAYRPVVVAPAYRPVVVAPAYRPAPVVVAPVYAPPPRVVVVSAPVYTPVYHPWRRPHWHRYGWQGCR